MRVTVTKTGGTSDAIVVRLNSGRELSAYVNQKGPLPHDVTHWVVERTFGIENGFWGHVSKGNSFDDIAALTKAGGHASSQRASAPTEEIIGLLQAERLVECFEADLWSTLTEYSTFCQVLDAGCRESYVNRPEVSPAQIEQVRAELARLLADWKALPIGGALILESDD